MSLPFARRTLLAVFSVIFAVGSSAVGVPARAAEIPPLDRRAEWFRHDRFGMFIHWGVYSVEGRGEWIQDTGRIPIDEYVKLYKKFNPKEFNAAEWVSLAKRAGQKYIVITTKHHDGFCMFDSKLTDYSIMHTPLGRDVCKELANECRLQGIKLGFYYSIMDWHHPDYVPIRKWERGKRSTDAAQFDRYVKYMEGQIRELMTGYGPIVALWFDGGWEHRKPTDKEAFKKIIDMARQLQPNILVNDRADVGGDYKTPEQQIPPTGILDKDGQPAMWEVCMTMTTGHGSLPPAAWWGYDKNETVFKPTEELLQKLVDVASKGGNFLLNVGPEPTGRIRPEEAERLEAVGRWMQTYGESIYGTSASPFRHLPFFGRVTRKGNRLYVHVFDWPADGRFILPGLRTPPVAARLLGRPTVKARDRNVDGVHEVALSLLKEAADPIDTVFVLDFDTPPVVEPLVLRPAADGTLDLPAAYAELLAQHGQRAKPMSEKGRVYIGNWSNPQDVPTWCFTMPAAGTYSVKLDARPASDAAVGQRIAVRVGKQQLVGRITKDGVALDGTLAIPAGQQELSVHLLDAKRTGPAILDLFSAQLVPEKDARRHSKAATGVAGP
jgi:alpha-L-fucosidase